MIPQASKESLAAKSENLHYVARQPIMDQRNRVHAYELLYRSSRTNAFDGDGDLATRAILDNSLVFGMDQLTGGLPAFVNCTHRSLVGDLVQILPSGIAVLEVLESVEPTSKLVAACRQLKRQGYRLALDDFVWKPGIEPMVELADYIKIDFVATGPDERKSLLQKLKRANTALLAEKIESPAQFEQARKEGFTLFQGFYFCHPTMVETRRIPANRLSQIEILRMLGDDSVDIDKLTQVVKHDASITYRLLRLVNSPACAVRQEVNSIQSALIAVGEEGFRRIATLAITSELCANQPAEVLRMAFVRAHFCEEVAGMCGMNAREQYLLGLLSLVPAMLRIPIEQLSPALPLRHEIRDALEGAPTTERCLLSWIEAYERGEWEACDGLAEKLGLRCPQLLRSYGHALGWAEDAFRSIG